MGAEFFYRPQRTSASDGDLQRRFSIKNCTLSTAPRRDYVKRRASRLDHREKLSRAPPSSRSQRGCRCTSCAQQLSFRLSYFIYILLPFLPRDTHLRPRFFFRSPKVASAAKTHCSCDVASAPIRCARLKKRAGNAQIIVLTLAGKETRPLSLVYGKRKK